jgi:competence protein ComEA
MVLRKTARVEQRNDRNDLGQQQNKQLKEKEKRPMRKSLFIALITLMLAVSSVAFAEEAAPSGGAPAQQAGVVNINDATASQLALLPGVGAKGAQRIVEYRTQHGSFRKTSDLMQVKGIGAKTFERMAPYIALSGSTTLTSKVAGPRKPRVKKQ